MKHKTLYLQNIYVKLFKEFLWKSSIHGLKVFLYFVPMRYAKKLWLLFITVVIIWTHYVIINLSLDFIEQPTEIRMSTNLVHVANSPFPAVAICSANKISKRKLMPFAEKVFLFQQTLHHNLLAKNVEEMSEHLLTLAGLYTFPFDDFNQDDGRLTQLHFILFNMYNGTEYPSRVILEGLAPDCNDIILRGMLFGDRINVSRLFLHRMTSWGACCMFNYIRNSNSTDPIKGAHDEEVIANVKAIKFESNSILNSVQFVMQADLEDYTFKETANDAFKLYIFPQEDYPAIQSDVEGEVLVDPNTIVEIPIQPIFVDASDSIREFPPRTRKCLFPEEGERLLNRSYYSFDECLLICRMESEMKHCGCVGPTWDVGQLNEEVPICNLLDLPCLTRWKRVWYGWNYFDYILNTEEEMKEHTSLSERCQHCMPTCSDISFDLNTNVLPLRKQSGGVYTSGLLTNLTHERPLAIVKLYFKQLFSQETVMDIASDWVVLLNRFGGIMSLMFGFSIISYIEVFYYLSGKWFLYICRATKLKAQEGKNWPTLAKSLNNKHSNEENAPYKLYWQELKPKNMKLNLFQRDITDFYVEMRKHKA